MRKHILIAAIVIAASSLIFLGCQKDNTENRLSTSENSALNTFSTTTQFSVTEAKNWFQDKQRERSLTTQNQDTSILKADPIWNAAYTAKSETGKEYLVVPLNQTGINITERVTLESRGSANILITKTVNSYKAGIVINYADENYYRQKNGNTSNKDYTGFFFFLDANGNFEKGVRYENGEPLYPAYMKVLSKEKTSGDRCSFITLDVEICPPSRERLSGCKTVRISYWSGCGGSSSGNFSGWGPNFPVPPKSGGGGSTEPDAATILANLEKEAWTYADILNGETPSVTLTNRQKVMGLVIDSKTWEEFESRWNRTNPDNQINLTGFTGTMTSGQKLFFIANPQYLQMGSEMALKAILATEIADKLGITDAKEIEKLMEKNLADLTKFKDYLVSPFADKVVVEKYLNYIKTNPTPAMAWEDFRTLEESKDALNLTVEEENNGPILRNGITLCASNLIITPSPLIPGYGTIGIAGIQGQVQLTGGGVFDVSLRNFFIVCPNQPALNGDSPTTVIASAITSAITILQNNINNGVAPPINRTTNPPRNCNPKEWLLLLINAQINAQYIGVSINGQNAKASAQLLPSGEHADPSADYDGSGRLGKQDTFGTVFTERPITSANGVCPP